MDLEIFPSYRNLFSDCSKLFLFSKNKSGDINEFGSQLPKYFK